MRGGNDFVWMGIFLRRALVGWMMPCWILLAGLAQAQAPPLICKVGGEMSQCALQGDFAYVLEGNQLTVLDIHDPNQPTLKGGLAIPSMHEDLAVSGTRAYVASREQGLQIIDIGNPEAPSLLSRYPAVGRTMSVTLAGSLALLASDEGGLRILDVSDPTSATLKGWTGTQQEAYDACTSGSLAFVACNGALKVVDISDPAAPAVRGTRTLAGIWMNSSVQVRANTVYVGLSSGSIALIDVSNPDQPALLCSLKTNSYPYDMAFDQDQLYVTVGKSGLGIYSASDPTTLTLRKKLPVGADYALGVAVSGSWACLCSGNDGLAMINVNDPEAPTLAGKYDMPDSVYHLAAAGPLVYVVDLFSRQLFVMDYGIPATPKVRGKCLLPSPYGSSVMIPSDVKLADNRIYVVNYSEGGLYMIDVSNPEAPAVLGSTNNQFTESGEVAIANGRAYVADSMIGLHVLNVSEPTTPTLLQTHSAQGPVNGVTVDGGLCYLATKSRGLRIVNADDLSLVGSYPAEGTGPATKIASTTLIRGNRAYLGFNNELTILDVSNPAYPNVLGSYSIPPLSGAGGAITHAQVASLAWAWGEQIFCLSDARGLELLDVSDPGNPRAIIAQGDWGSAFYPTGFATTENLLLTGDLLYGLAAFDLGGSMNNAAGGGWRLYR